MFNRVGNFFTQAKNKTMAVFSNKEAKKELAMDTFIIAPYVVTDVLLYYASFLNFLSGMASDPAHPENESWYPAVYTTGTIIISVALAPALFLAFSDTAGRMFNIQDNDYRNVKNRARKIVGLPGSLTKVLVGDSSLYNYLVSSNIPQRSAIGMACTAGVLALPALASFFWSKHDKADHEPDEAELKSKTRAGKQALAYLTSACYAMDVGFVYFHSALNIPKNMGFLNHDLSKFQNEAEHAAYIVICIGAVIESTAVFLAYARLNANMFGLIYEENNVEKGCWVAIEASRIKQGLGSFAVLFKIFNTAVSAFHFFRHRMPEGANLAFVTYSSLSGVFAQASLLFFDPLNNQHKPRSFPAIEEEKENSEHDSEIGACNPFSEIELSVDSPRKYTF